MCVWMSRIFRVRPSGTMTVRCRSTTRMALASAPMPFFQARGSAVSTVKCRPRTGSNDLRMKP